MLRKAQETAQSQRRGPERAAARGQRIVGNENEGAVVVCRGLADHLAIEHHHNLRTSGGRSGDHRLAGLFDPHRVKGGSERSRGAGFRRRLFRRGFGLRGRGLLGAIELVANKATGQAFVGGAVGGFAQKAAQDNGLLLRAVAGSSLGFCPPLIITTAQIDEIIEKTAIALDVTLDHCVREKLLV